MVSVSAVIPTYNGTAYLAEAVQSALSQTYELLEIIVVDDGSQEDIKKILAPYFPKVTYVHQENAGPAAARNRGISLAKGDVIALLDDDDVWHPTKTAEQIKLLVENPRCAMVYSYPELIDEHGRMIPNETPSEFPSGNVYLEFLTRNRITSPSATLIRKDVFKTVGLFDEHNECISCEDYELWVRIAGDYDVMFCPGGLTSYRVRKSGISQNFDKHLKARLYVFSKLVTQHNEAPKTSDIIFYAAYNYNKYNTLRNYSYKYYYKQGDRGKAKELMMKTLIRYPCCFKDILYLVIFFMPDSLFWFLKKTKHRLSAVSIARM